MKRDKCSKTVWMGGWACLGVLSVVLHAMSTPPNTKEGFSCKYYGPGDTVDTCLGTAATGCTGVCIKIVTIASPTCGRCTVWRGDRRRSARTASGRGAADGAMAGTVGLVDFGGDGGRAGHV